MSDPGATLAGMTSAAGTLERTLLRQELVVSRAQALACGLSLDALRHRIRPAGPWQRLLPGVYLTVTGTPTRRQAEVAALLYAGRGSVITGLAALRRHGVRVSDSAGVTVLVPAGRTRQSRSYVRVCPTTRMPGRVCSDGAVQFVLPPRAVADAARELTSYREVRALVAGAVQQGRCRIDLLSGEVDRGPRRRSAWLRRALAEAADGVRSAAEGDLRDLLRRAGLQMPIFNARLYAGRVLIAVADAWWPEAGVAVEVDSREWHFSPDEWEGTLRRHARMAAHGIVALHFTPRQIREDGAEVAAHIRGALSAGYARARPGIRAVAGPG